MTPDNHRLPDQLRANLRLVFVGTAASTRSAGLGYYYAHPGNRFWRALHEAGITPRRYQPSEFAALARTRHRLHRSVEIRRRNGSRGRAGNPSTSCGFRTKIATYRPKTIAFTSKKAASLFYGRPTRAIALGRQPPMSGFPDVFVLSSPSGAASGHWTLQPWRELAEWIGPA